MERTMPNERISFLKSGAIKLKGLPDEYVEFVTEFTLKDRAQWKKFVHVFKEHEDVKDAGWRGEFWGKMMRGASLCYYYSRDEKLYDVLTETVKDLLQTQDDAGRISSYDEEHEFCGWDMWARKYVITGLLHYSDVCRDERLKRRILDSLKRHLDYIVQKIGEEKGKKKITETSNVWGGVNSCTILEPTLEMYKRTGEKRYLDFAEYILSTGGSSEGDMIKAAAENKIAPCEYPVKKAYEVMSFFEGVLAYYELTKKDYYFNAVSNFVEAVQKTEITVIGCAGMLGECFNYAVKKQTEEVEGPTQETCVTVTWMRLLARLYSLTGNTEYIDRAEIAALNGLYGSINVHKLEGHTKGQTTGRFAFDSYSPLYNGCRDVGTGGLKELREGGNYGCCASIGSVGVALVPLLAVMKSDRGYIINEYFQAEIDDGEFVFSLEGDYLGDGKIVLTIEKSDDKERELSFRVPTWADKYTVSTEEGSKVWKQGKESLSKVWKKGESIIINIETALSSYSLNGYVVYRYGPLVLARDNLKGECKNEPSEAGFDLSADTTAIERRPPEKGETIRFELSGDGKSIILTDYASCGKLWQNADNQISVWLKSSALSNIK